MENACISGNSLARMKQSIARYIVITTLLASTSCRQSTNEKAKTNTTAGDTLPMAASLQKAAETSMGVVNNFLTSTYHDVNATEQIKAQDDGLRELSAGKFFTALHAILLPALPGKHQDYFDTNTTYQLVSYSKGSLFHDSSEDYAFIIYNQERPRILILVYDEQADQYYELYKDIPVESGLTPENCNYGTFGTLDYLIAEELIYGREYFIKKPEDFLESSACKITDISKDSSFVLKDGCFSKKADTDSPGNSLCIATSNVYNNWECMRFDTTQRVFHIFYGQAFAD